MPLESSAEHFDRATRLLAICTLDGRYRDKVEPLANYTNEYGLIATRIEVEANHLVRLCETGSQLATPLGRTLNPQERDFLLALGPNLTLDQAIRIKEIEDTTDHDVDAMVRAFREWLGGTTMMDLLPLIHYPLTSEDVNNLSYRLMMTRARDQIIIPTLDGVVDTLLEPSREYARDPMLDRTHGQAAAGSTLGKELVVFAKRLNRQNRKLAKLQLVGKFNGAVGNFNAHIVGAPEFDWIRYSEDFIKGFGFEPELITTQIAPYEDVAEMMQTYQRINGVIIDFDQDMWRYISDDWFKQIVRAGETGSSTMAHKVNPIYFERSEGNAYMGTGIFEAMARKLGQSRLQRDLSDSTTVRCIGLGLGFSLLSYLNTMEGFSRVLPNTELMQERLGEAWSTLSEPAQIIMRRRGVGNGYDYVKAFTRGMKLDQIQWLDLVYGLPLPDADKEFLASLTPNAYTGLASRLAEIGIEQIMNSRQSTT